MFILFEGYKHCCKCFTMCILLSTYNVFSATQVAFSAEISTRLLTGILKRKTVIFNSVITNIGHGYSTSTGTFTAPQSGLYIFNLDIMVRAANRQCLELVKNSFSMMKTYMEGTATNYASFSRMVILQLSRGDRVWVRSKGGDGILEGNGYSSFSGWLVS